MVASTMVQMNGPHATTALRYTVILMPVEAQKGLVQKYLLLTI